MTDKREWIAVVFHGRTSSVIATSETEPALALPAETYAKAHPGVEVHIFQRVATGRAQTGVTWQ